MARKEELNRAETDFQAKMHREVSEFVASWGSCDYISRDRNIARGKLESAAARIFQAYFKELRGIEYSEEFDRLI